MNEITTTAHRLNNIRFQVKDEGVGTLLLTGLPDEYRPIVMSLEKSDLVITGDTTKVKLQVTAKNAEIKSNEIGKVTVNALKNWQVESLAIEDWMMYLT